MEKFTGWVLHAVMLMGVSLACGQVAVWYYNHSPVLGVDFFNTVTYAKYLGTHDVPLVGGWKYIWWMGQPLAGDYATLHMFILSPFVKYLGAVQTVLVYVVGAMWLFAIGCYWLFYEVGKSRWLAAGLAGGVVFSIGVYGAATWGGSLPYFATQSVLPWSLFLIAKFIRSGKMQWLGIAGMVVGASMWGHLLPAIITVGPLIVIMLAMGTRGGVGSRMKAVAVFGVVAALVGYVQLYFKTNVPVYVFPFWLVQNALGMAVNLAPKSPAGAGATLARETAQYAQEFAKFNIGNLQLIVRETNQNLFMALAGVAVLFGLGLGVARKPSRYWGWAVMAIPLAYQLVYVWLYSRGISLLHGGWYRVFWPIPVGVGMLVCGWWYEFGTAIEERWGGKVKNVTVGVLGMVVGVGVGGGVWIQRADFFAKIEDPKSAYVEASSAWPMLVNYLTRKQDEAQIKRLVKPEWMEADTWQKRLYTADAQVNIWWNSVFDLPLFRGYTDPLVGTNLLGGYFWWDVTATNDQLTKVFKYPEEVAVQNAKFLIDWYALNYIETGTGASSYSALSKYIDTPDFIAKHDKRVLLDIPELIKYYLGKGELTLKSTSGHFRTQSLGMGEYQVMGQGVSRLDWANGDYKQWRVTKNDGTIVTVKELLPDHNGSYVDQLDTGRIDLRFKYTPLQEMNFYEFNSDLTSRVLEPTNAVVMGVVGDVNYYESVIRTLGLVNLNSKKLIPLFIRKPLDQLTGNDLKNVDVLLLYGYRGGSDEVWRQLDGWVRKGGKLWVDTGGESWETNKKQLPSIFPVAATIKKTVGGITSPKNIDLSEFGPWQVDGQPWQFSVGEKMRGGEVWLESEGQPLIVTQSVDLGRVVWSGINLPYHANLSRVIAEGRLFEDLLNFLIPVHVSKPAETIAVDRPNPQTINVKFTNARGILFKEQDYGWKAYVNGRQTNVYAAGPAYPGFVYVPVEDRGGEVKLVYNAIEMYSGVSYILAVATIIWMVDWVVFKAIFLGRLNRMITAKASSLAGGWKDEDS